jgi:RNA-directed DNA polymerase
MMTEIPEPKDKLDAATEVVVSGPEDDAERWRQVDWRRAEADVRRLRQRIFTASRAGDLQKVRRLQKLMLRSRANTLLSVRRVTERNAGRLTAGVDGEVVLTPEAKMQLVDRLQHGVEPFKAMPVRRVYIPKPGGKRRPLGIPVILDRVHQARVVNALEPEWEARFEPRSYGFRPGRGCQDAIQAIHMTAKGERAAGVGAGRGSGIGVRPDRPRPHSDDDRRVPREGNDPGVAEGWRDRARSAASHRERCSSGLVMRSCA